VATQRPRMGGSGTEMVRLATLGVLIVDRVRNPRTLVSQASAATAVSGHGERGSPEAMEERRGQRQDEGEFDGRSAFRHVAVLANTSGRYPLYYACCACCTVPHETKRAYAALGSCKYRRCSVQRLENARRCAHCAVRGLFSMRLDGTQPHSLSRPQFHCHVCAQRKLPFVSMAQQECALCHQPGQVGRFRPAQNSSQSRFQTDHEPSGRDPDSRGVSNSLQPLQPSR
jgi:hypothetical protein